MYFYKTRYDIFNTSNFCVTTVSNPYVNLNQSEILVQFASGAGFQVTENHGALNVIVLLPLEFKVCTLIS